MGWGAVAVIAAAVLITGISLLSLPRHHRNVAVNIPSRESYGVTTRGAWPAEVRSFALLVERPDPREKVDTSTDYTVKRLRSLAEALRSVAEEEGKATPRFQEKIISMKRRSDKLEKSDPSLHHADLARRAFIDASEAFDEIRKPAGDTSYPARRLELAARDVDPKTPLSRQKEKVKVFFREASRALQTNR